jgi:hypothetical protein
MTLNKVMSFAAALTLAVALSGAASAAQFKNRTNSPPPAGPSKLTGQQHTVKDLYCGPGHQPCDDLFWAYCKLIGGTPSGRQPWGGKTCFHPTEW